MTLDRGIPVQTAGKPNGPILILHLIAPPTVWDRLAVDFVCGKYDQFCWTAEQKVKQFLPSHSHSPWQPSLSYVPQWCMLAEQQELFWDVFPDLLGAELCRASQAGLLIRITFYLNASFFHVRCSRPCKGETQMIRSKSNLATWEFRKAVWRFLSSAECGREGEQDNAYFKPELSDFYDFFEERKHTFCSLLE